MSDDPMSTPMTELLDTNIKEIIRRHAEVAEVLEAHGIACVTCGVGTCLLKDIIEIHALADDAVRSVLTGVAQVVFPGQDVEIPRLEAKPPAQPASLSPPIKRLMDEHANIKRLIGLAPYLTDRLRDEPEAGRQLIRDAVEFIGSYADRFHHAKEEDILFGFFDQSAAIFGVMRDDHVTARSHVTAIRAGLDDLDDDQVVTNLQSYVELLTAHIRKEDEVLYPWMDRNLTTRQVGELFARFAQVDGELGDDASQRIEFLDGLEEEALSSRAAV